MFEKARLLLLCLCVLMHKSTGKSFYDLIYAQNTTTTEQPSNGNGSNNSNNSSSSIATTTTTITTTQRNRDITIGPCTWAIERKCPDNDVKFYLYTRRNIMDRQYVYIDDSLDKSNLTASFFDARHPTKIIIHGYNSDMFLNPLQKMRDEYLAKSEYNVIYVDWSVLSPGPCYISAVHNTKHAGACVAQLVERILETGTSDIHIIGFSLGAQVPNYVARNLGSFMLPRITGLDPAMPLFITATADDKLDASDAVFVDVMHTNALVQGKLERCGHADFYMNGGIIQPGCYMQGPNPFACSHQRAPAYFLESIRTHKGFWGWSCSSYISYLLGMCPPTNYLQEAGENIRTTTRGMFLIDTNDTQPYALGKWTDLPTLGIKQPKPTLMPPQRQNVDPLLQQVDAWGKLASNFNNLEKLTPTPYSQDPYGDNWTYFSSAGIADITNNVLTKGSEAPNESVEEQAIHDDNHEDEDNDNILQNDDTDNNVNDTAINWYEYRKNLTEGFIDNSIFRVPQIGR